MIKYYTKEFTKSLHENISEWFNSFEEQRNGKPFSTYGFKIENTSIVGDNIIITIMVYGHE